MNFDVVSAFMGSHPAMWLLAFAVLSLLSGVIKDKAPRLSPLVDFAMHLFPMNLTAAYAALPAPVPPPAPPVAPPVAPAS